MKTVAVTSLLMFAFVNANAQEAAQSPTPGQFSRPRSVTSAPAQSQQQPAQQPAQQTAPSVVAPVKTATPQMPASASPAAQPNGTTVPAQPAATAPPLATPVVVPSIALKPAAPISPNKVRARILESQRLLKTRITPTALSQSPNLNFVTLAALDDDSSQIHLLTLAKEIFLKKDTEVTVASSLGGFLRVRVVRSNYVNTAVTVSDLTGRQLAPLLVEYPIEKFGRYRETAYYTSAHPALLTPELVKNGQLYVRTMVDLAAKRLKDKGHHMTPEVLDMAERLCLVEHVDHDRFRKESRLAVFNEVYALYALNELDTYRYSVSTAGAGGMVQMIPWTYQMLRQRYPAVGLNPDFVLGMRNHGNALEAMLLYIRDTWSDLTLNETIADALATGIATPADLIAAGYNSNPAKLAGYIRRGGAAWRTLIPRETQIYLQIYQALEFTTPIKARAKQPEKAPTATPTVQPTEVKN
ncbi:MAG TPA: hypothetical protein VGO96_03060 [Pyrinomonadaceae bacterium]|jgi:hypothetical protein|nr:hypothetical protein [Pyrinomonadaceae bacterium]